jgi:ferredoxin
MCAELLPERISLDRWGYPLLDGEPVDGELLEHARRAASACPTFALLVERNTRASIEPLKRSPVPVVAVPHAARPHTR